MDLDSRIFIEFNRIVLKIARDFINSPIHKMQETIENALEMIALYCGSNRITVYTYDWDKQIMFLKYEWMNQKDRQSGGGYQMVPFSLIPPTVFEKHMAGEHYTIRNSQEPKEMITTSLPIISEGKLMGTCVLKRTEEQNEWDQQMLSSLTIFCELLSGALERIECKNRLIEKNKELHLIFNATSDAIAMVDLNGIVLEANISFGKKFGYTAEEMSGRNIFKCLREDEKDDFVKKRIRLFKEVIRTGKLRKFEYTRDGITFRDKLYPVLKNGSVYAVVIFSMDITDKIKTIEQTRKTEAHHAKMCIQKEFFMNISHEFKTPLAVILGQMELMQIYLEDSKKLQKYIWAARQNAYRLNRLIENFLDSIKLDVGYMKTNMCYEDIVRILKETTERASAYAAVKKIDLQFNTNLLGYNMAVDRYQTERILLNLLTNAVKFTPKGGRITVTVKGRAESVLIIVSGQWRGDSKRASGCCF